MVGPDIPLIRDVSKETVTRLLAGGFESLRLDFKSRIDLSDNRALAEFAKDVAAMATLGGYLLVGVDGSGRITGDVEPADAPLWDEARLVSKLAKWLPEPIDILTAFHELSEGCVVLIYVHPHPEGFYIMKSVANYMDESGRSKTIFREGAIFGRQGTRSGPLKQHQVRTTIARLIADQKESWRAEFLSNMQEALRSGTLGADLARGPASLLTWQLPTDSLASALVELARSSDRVPVRLLLRQTPRLAERALARDAPDLSINELLDRVSVAAAVAVTVDDRESFDDCLAALSAVYQRGLDINGARRHDLAIPAPLLWRDVLAHVYALGGLIIRVTKWDWIPGLVLRGPIRGEMEWYGNWVRHGITEAARANQLTRTNADDKIEQVAVIELARDVAGRVPYLGDDLPEGDEGILNSICQFDALAALVAMRHSSSTDSRYFYTNSAHFRPERTTPVLDRLVSDETMRTAVGLEDLEFLAAAMLAYFKMAEGESPRLGRWWFRSGGTAHEWAHSQPER